MRRRLIAILLILGAAAVAGFAIPLLDSAAQERTQRLLIDRTATVNRFAGLAQQAITTRERAGLDAEVRAYVSLYGEDVLVLDRGRQVLARAGGLDPADPAVRPLVDGALRNEPGQPLPTLRPWTRASTVLSRPVGNGTRVSGVVLLRVDPAPAAADLARSWAVIGLGALLVAAVFTALAVVLTRWLLRPLSDLDTGVAQVAAGRRGAHVPVRGGPPELRALSTSFNRMSDAVAAAEETERRLVADASHQLRNPMAALRLRLDALAADLPASARSRYRPVAVEVERLESLLDGLLALGSADRRENGADAEGLPADPSAVAHDQVEAWRAAADASRVRIDCAVPDRLPDTRCPDSELSQVLDVLLDNGIRYAGAGATVTVDGEERPRSVLLTVTDDGPGLTGTELASATRRFWRAPRQNPDTGTGLGLAIADRLVSVHGGTLTLRAHRPHGLRVEVELPRDDATDTDRRPR